MTTTRIIAILCACVTFYGFGFVTGVYQTRQWEKGAARGTAYQFHDAVKLVQGDMGREVQSKPEPLTFSVCSLCLRPFADGARREWKAGSRDIVWEREN